MPNAIEFALKIRSGLCQLFILSLLKLFSLIFLAILSRSVLVCGSGDCLTYFPLILFPRPLVTSQNPALQCHFGMLMLLRKIVLLTVLKLFQVLRLLWQNSGGGFYDLSYYFIGGLNMSIEISAYFGQKHLFRKRSDFLSAMEAELNTVKTSFYKLGMYLSEAYVKRYNLGTGTDDFFEWVDNTFGLGKSTVYNLMRVYNVFHDHKDHTVLAERWNGFSQTQLTELLPAAEWLNHIDFVKPSDSCAVLRDVVKISKSMHNTPIGECADSMEYIGRFGSLLKKNSSQLEKVKPLKGEKAFQVVRDTLVSYFKDVLGITDIAACVNLSSRIVYDILCL